MILITEAIVSLKDINRPIFVMGKHGCFAVRQKLNYLDELQLQRTEYASY
jgi:hypothetical protein